MFQGVMDDVNAVKNTSEKEIGKSPLDLAETAILTWPRMAAMQIGGAESHDGRGEG
jgi:hypothetical protein